MKKEKIIDTEKMLIAAINGKTLKDVGIENTKENNDFLRLLQASVDKSYRSGYDVDIPT